MTGLKVTQALVGIESGAVTVVYHRPVGYIFRYLSAPCIAEPIK